MFNCFGNSRRLRTLLLSLIFCGVFVVALVVWVTQPWKAGINLPYGMQLYQKAKDKSVTLFYNTTPRPRILPTIIPQQAWVRYPDDLLWQGYRLPVLTAQPHGRLGNVLMEYATLYALSRVYNVSAVVHPDMKRDLKYFENISLPNMPGPYNPKDWTVIQSLEKNILNYAPLELAASGLLGPHQFLIKQWPHEIQLFDLVRDEIRQQFTWNKEIWNTVQTYIRNVGIMLKKKGKTKPVFIGVHVRRTDYIKFIEQFGGSEMPTTIYFKRAFEYYKNKYKDAFFIISTDDQDYVNQEFKLYKDDIILTPGMSPQVDMALLTACNHSVITLGTYSFWTGYLTGGEVLYPDLNFTNKKYYFAKPFYEGVRLYFKPIPPRR
ncbi:unnamed protein product, partial [Meganyctiphanes norvegica]